MIDRKFTARPCRLGQAPPGPRETLPRRGNAINTQWTSGRGSHSTVDSVTVPSGKLTKSYGKWMKMAIEIVDL